MRHLVRLMPLLVVLALALPARLAAPDEPPPPAPGEEKPSDEPPPILPTDGPPADDTVTPKEVIKKRERALWAPPEGAAAALPATPAGMVYVPAGRAVIGTAFQELGQLLQGYDKTVTEQFIFEGPLHYLDMPAFFVDRYEVTNAQYLHFLKAYAYEKHTTEGTLGLIDEVAAHMLGMALEEVRKPDAPYARQLYQANRAQLHEKMPQVVVRSVAGEVDEEATWRKLRVTPLARGIAFEFYRLAPPSDWGGMVPAEDMLDLPVRWVSYNDAALYAEWAGKHIPTEEEWEYAARGPEGYLYPWGDTWYHDERVANWGGKVTRKFVPVTVPVDGNPRAFTPHEGEIDAYNGMSWCGVWHMLGNVWEWTSSWFGPYPGNERQHPWMNEYVKVLRGASFEDASPLVLRLPVRNWVGLGAKGPPLPANRFENVGFRCAWYGNPGQDQLPMALARVGRGRHVTTQTLALERWVGAAAVRFAAPDAKVEHHVYVTGAAQGLILVPKQSLLVPGEKKVKIKDRSDLDGATATEDQILPLAMFHTDVPLKDIWVRDLAEIEKQRERKGGRRRTKPEPPPVMKAVIDAGTYVLAVWHGRLCLARPDMDFIGFLSEKRTPAEKLTVQPVKDGLPPTLLEVTPVADLIDIGFAVPIGGNGDEGGGSILVVKNVLLETPAGALGSDGVWVVGRAGDVPKVAEAPVGAAPAVEEPKPEPPTPATEEPKPGEAQPGEAKPDEPQPGEAKPAGPAPG